MNKNDLTGQRISHPVHLVTEGTILRGYDQGIFHAPFKLTEVQFERIKYAYSSRRGRLYDIGKIFLGSAISFWLIIGVIAFDEGSAGISSGHWIIAILSSVVCLTLFVAGYFSSDLRQDTLNIIEKHFDESETKDAIMRRPE